MNTADGGVDDAADQWVVENYKEMISEVAKADKDFSKVVTLFGNFIFYHIFVCCRFILLTSYL